MSFSCVESNSLFSFIFSLLLSCLLVLSLFLSLFLSPCCVVWSWCRCGRGVCLVCVCVCVCCGTVKKREKKTVHTFKTLSVCRFKTSPCVPAPSPHVGNMWAWCQYTRKRFERKHGKRFGWTHGGGGGGHRQFCLPKFAHLG